MAFSFRETRLRRRMALTIGILHPGEMGTSVGAAAQTSGNEVLWCSAGRSNATRMRADGDRLVAVDRLETVSQRCDLILSVCPPAKAVEVASSIADLGFAGVYVDANAVSPATARRISKIVKKGGAAFLDGSIVGPPAREPGKTLLFLSGEDCSVMETIFRDSFLDTHIVDTNPGAASAVKMAFAGWTKGSAALLLGIRALAEAEGVTDGLLHAWRRFAPELDARSKATAHGTAAKAWRFTDEMHEIAATFDAVGLPSGFHDGAAQIFERMAGFQGGDADLAKVLRALLQRGSP